MTRAIILLRQELAKKWETMKQKLTNRLKTGKLIQTQQMTFTLNGYSDCPKIGPFCPMGA